MDDTCSNCGSTMTHLHPAQPDRWDEPGHGDYWECLNCGHTWDYDKWSNENADSDD